jgi:hypothetical protein
MGERLQWSEVEAVVRAYRAEHGGVNRVDIDTLAQALGTSRNDVRRMAGRSRRFTDRSGVLSAVLAGVLSINLLAFGGLALLRKHPALAVLYPTASAPIAPSDWLMESPTDASRVLVQSNDGKVEFFFRRTDENL